MAKAKLTAAEKDRRKHERKAKSLNKAAQKNYGPLFAHLATKVMAEDAYWRWRQQKVGESPTGEWAMQMMQLSRILSYDEKVLGKEVTDKLVAAL